MTRPKALIGRIFVCICLLQLFGTPALMAGAGDSGGGDNPSPEHGAAWFLGNRVIQYCVDVAPGFGVSTAGVDEAIQTGFAIWKSYIIDHGINSFPLASAELALNVAKLEKCTGKEDLKFYFGVLNDEIDKVKQLHENPSAFVYRTAYDSAQGWGKGFIWFAPPGSVYPESSFPDWKLPFRLTGMLLHELGHIYGCEHVDGTIMTSSMFNLLSVNSLASSEVEERTRYLLTHIDGTRELMMNWAHTDYQGFIVPEFAAPIISPGPHEPKDDPNVTFRRFFGREPVGSPRARFRRIKEKAFLTLTDDVDVADFEILNRRSAGSFGDYAPLFKTFKGMSVAASSPSYHVEYGSIINQEGTPYLVTIEYGEIVSGSPVTLHYFSGANRYSLFWAKLPGKPF